jgi:hypothetical protein
MKSFWWQGMALGGAIVVGLSAAIPDSDDGDGGGSHTAGFEVVVGDGVVEAVVTLDPDATLSDVWISSPDATFGDPVEVEPGVWVAEAELASGCVTATAEVTLGGAGGEVAKKLKKAKTKKGKVKKGKSTLAPDDDSDHHKAKRPKKAKKAKKRVAAPTSSVVLTLTASGCTPEDDPPAPPR